jgi:hypothetical protein
MGRYIILYQGQLGSNRLDKEATMMVKMTKKGKLTD